MPKPKGKYWDKKKNALLQGNSLSWKEKCPIKGENAQIGKNAKIEGKIPQSWKTMPQFNEKYHVDWRKNTCKNKNSTDQRNQGIKNAKIKNNPAKVNTSDYLGKMQKKKQMWEILSLRTHRSIHTRHVHPGHDVEAWPTGWHPRTSWTKESKIFGFPTMKKWSND